MKTSVAISCFFLHCFIGYTSAYTSCTADSISSIHKGVASQINHMRAMHGQTGNKNELTLSVELSRVAYEKIVSDNRMATCTKHHHGWVRPIQCCADGTEDCIQKVLTNFYSRGDSGALVGVGKPTETLTDENLHDQIRDILDRNSFKFLLGEDSMMNPAPPTLKMIGIATIDDYIAIVAIPEASTTASHYTPCTQEVGTDTGSAMINGLNLFVMGFAFLAYFITR